MRRKPRIDSNQNAIVVALREAGCSVQSLAAIGNGCPDLLVARHGKTWLMEVKDGAKPPSGRKLTEDERSWHAGWKATVYIVASVERALYVVG